MEDKYIFVEYLSSVNNVINETFLTTKRIKFTSCDISNNYLIFGASSGGIYIFKRDPCEFIKLIPSKEGSAVKILISPNEKNLAIGSSKGLVLILEDFFVDLNLRLQVFNEHQGQVITAMKWSGNDLYCGDDTGKVSVVSLPNSLSKAIFQSPATGLMQLDSSIVQLDVYSKYILVSTETRSYLCDTEHEHYKQIGKKLHEGCFGACFLNISTKPTPYQSKYHLPTGSGLKRNSNGLFKFLSDKLEVDVLQMAAETRRDFNLTKDIKIYCARKSLRLWEVNFDASVKCTHEFRENLPCKELDLFVIGDELNCRLEVEKCEPLFDFTISKIYPLHNRFVLTFNSKGIYIFDVNRSALVFWLNQLSNIRDVLVLGSLIYIWHNKMDIKIYSVALLEEIILKTLIKKQYLLCADICIYFEEEVRTLIEMSSKIHLISVLKKEINDSDLLEKLGYILSILETKSKSLILKLNNGIVQIDNPQAHSSNLDLLNESKPESVSNNSEAKEIGNDPISIFAQQYKLNKTHPKIKTTQFVNLIKSFKDLNEFFSNLNKFTEYATANLAENASDWCQVQFLDYAHTFLLPTDNLLAEDLLLYLKTSFSAVNSEIANEKCKCSFPLPKAHKILPKYYQEYGKYFKISSQYFKEIPYFYKDYLANLNDNFQETLPLIIQFSDEEIIQMYLSKFNYDIWDEALKLFIRLKVDGCCLNCGNKIDNEGAIEWSRFGLFMVQSITATNAIKLLKRYSKLIPKGELDAGFYQVCIFSTAANIRGDAFQGVQKIVSKNNDSPMQFEKLMEKFLHKKHQEKHGLVSLSLLNTESSSSSVSAPKCTYCDLPMNVPIINEQQKLKCLHPFHKICKSLVNNTCTICKSKI